MLILNRFLTGLGQACARLGLLSVALSCWSGPALAQDSAVQPATAQPVTVVASFSILGDWAHQIGGDDVRVITLVGPDADAHTYQPTTEDLRAIAGADLILSNGLGFEGWMPRLVAAAQAEERWLRLGEGVKPRRGVADEEEDHAKEGREHHSHGPLDPHAWQNVGNAIIYVDMIAAALQKLAPERATAFVTRAGVYRAQLIQLDQDMRIQWNVVPDARRVVITSHDAFGYYAEAYGVRFLAPQGISTEAAASAKGLAKLNKQIKEYGVKSIFLESNADPRLMNQLAKDTHVTVGGTLYADALSDAAGPASDYIAMMRHNLSLMIDATGK